MLKIGLYIGRFQPFHNGHKKIVDTMLLENEKNIVLIGLSEDAQKNPFDYNARLHFFTHTYSPEDSIFFYPLPDEISDTQWIQNILDIPEIDFSSEIVIYAGDLAHDSAIAAIKKQINMFGIKKIEFREISRSTIPISGTQLRKNIKLNGIKSIKNDIPLDVYEYIKTH